MARRRESFGGGGMGGTPDFRSLANAFFRLSRPVQLAIGAVLLVAAVVAAVLYLHSLKTQQQTTPAAAASDQMLLGNPSGATADPSRRDNYLMVKPYFALSYNDGTGTPNWVSWRVTKQDMGTARRKPMFDPDNTLPPGFHVVRHEDYKESGFDRGHMCPHSDRAADETMSFATFVMTNIIPQAPNVNQKAWKNLEDYGRDLVREPAGCTSFPAPPGKGKTARRGASGPAVTRRPSPTAK